MGLQKILLNSLDICPSKGCLTEAEYLLDIPVRDEILISHNSTTLNVSVNVFPSR